MKKDYTHITVILDRSGSMEKVKEDTIGGFNAFLNEQKNLEGEATISIIQFDNEYEYIAKFKPIQEVEELNSSTYKPRGMTALYDALGKAIKQTGKTLRNMKEEDRPEKVVFVILTDGYENASKKYTADNIKDKIEHQQSKYNWDFTYIGANQDAILVGNSMGISKDKSLNFAADNVKGTMFLVSSYVTKGRTDSFTRSSYSISDRKEAMNDISTKVD